jgi:four helix bundle protein
MTDKIRNFYDLDSWKKGHLLVIEIYKITEYFPREEMYGIIGQTRRAASSITANLAEGFARYYFKDKVRFYYNARGSVSEVQDFILIAKDLGYIDIETCRRLGEDLNEIAKLINGLIKSTNKNNL